jgi:hypothetical protein
MSPALLGNNVAGKQQFTKKFSRYMLSSVFFRGKYELICKEIK